MLVTAYSPHAASCGQFADGQTATLHSVRTNGGALVAADIRVLPYGSMLTIDGYAGDEIVPVLDCGGAIKGNRLDLLFPTHEAALAWGVRRVEVVVWEYAMARRDANTSLDGSPARIEGEQSSTTRTARSSSSRKSLMKKRSSRANTFQSM